MNYERPYYEDLNMRPFLFYVVFGATTGELQVSKKRHHVDEMPEGLVFQYWQSAGNKDDMEDLMGGVLGELLKEQNEALYRKACAEETWALISGEVHRDSDLSYMRNAIGFVQALVDSGAIAVLDLQTFTLMSGEDWTKKIFEPEFHPCEHATILASKDENGALWLHTRGMRKFGRPDISMENVEQKQVDLAAGVISEMIFLGAQGAFFSRKTKLHLDDKNAVIVTPQYVDDFDNDDFNNSYYRMNWAECELIEEGVNG